MSRRILVPVDGSPHSGAALEYALREFPDAALTVLHVIDPVEGSHSVQRGIQLTSEEWYERARADARELFEDARETAEEHDRTLRTETVVGRPARTIVEYADEEGFDQVVMGSHGRSGVSRILLGSVAETVVRRAEVPVTVVR